jgi:hypothetical protein
MTVPNTTYRVLVEKLGDSDPSQFIGNEGEIFYDPNNPELKLSNGTTLGGISIGGGGTTGVLTINDIEDNSYTLQLSDAGKAILGYDTNITIPSDDDVDFPIGTIITLIVSSDDVVILSGGGEGGSSVILAGTEGNSSVIWGIPRYNIATLIKVIANGWLLSGPGIYNAD